MATDGPVISGLAYTVTEIDGHPPTGLAGCLGDRTLTLVGSGLSHRVRGTGIDHLGGVRFHQKDLGPGGRDVRVWTITHPGDHVLLAQHCPASEPPASARPRAASEHRLTCSGRHPALVVGAAGSAARPRGPCQSSQHPHERRRPYEIT